MELAGHFLEFGNTFFLWFLLLVPPIFLWGFFSDAQKITTLIIRALILALIILALSAPRGISRERSRHLVALVDTSGSIPEVALKSASKSIASFSADDRKISLISFAKTASKKAIHLSNKVTADEVYTAIQRSSSALARGASNIERGLQAAANGSGPILLFSDGRSTEGDLSSGAKRLAARGRKVYPVLIEQDVFLKKQLEISSLFAKVTARAGAKEKIFTSIRNTDSQDQASTLEVWLEDKLLYSKEVKVKANSEISIQNETPELSGGLQRIRSVLKNSDGTSTTKHRWISVKEKSKLLVVHGSEDDKSQLYELIRLKGYSAEHFVADNSQEIPSTFTSYSAVLLNNVPKVELPSKFLPELELFSRKGGGVLIIGGDKSFGLGGYIDTPLEKLSPLKFKPPQTKKKRLRVALALVMDKSGSMGEQNRLIGAKRAAVMSLDSLKDDDYITIIGFDHAPFLIVDIKTIAEAKQEIDKRLESLTPAGQTNLLPALGMARQMLVRSKASRKHMIILSDGQFSGTNSIYLNEINELKREGISVSTVALGSEADLPFLRYLAQTGRGAFHHTLDASRLPKIFVEDIKVATGEETMAERQLFPVGIGPGGLRSTEVRGYPALKGFVETLPKKGSTLELITRRNKKVHPILASWKYAKGRVAAFTSDANGRWSQLWLSWPKFVSFWNDLLEWIRSGDTGKISDLDFDVRYSLSRGALSFELLVYDDKLRNSPPPPIIATIISPGNEQSNPTFASLAPGRFSTEIPNAQAGDYKLSIRYGSTDLPPIGVTLDSDSFGEQAGGGVEYEALEKIAELSNGALNPSPQSLQLEEVVEKTRKELYPYLLCLAFLLVLAEAIIRERLNRSALS